MEKTLGQYKIVREIAKGGMGIIYKALNPATQKTVAIKVLPPMMVDRVTVERFHREAQAMTQLKHPNMIEVYESGMQEGKHFLVMEFVEGDNLKNLITAKGPLPIERVIKISVCVADALAHMHQRGMIHRDIKPGNIMILPDGRVKLMDYGLVKILGRTSVTVEGSSLGTAEYMSPEQITGEGVDSRTDIYSLGITMYEMVTGRLAFEADTLQELLHKHQTQAALAISALRPQGPFELESMINKAMAKNLVNRYSCAQDLKNDLQKLSKEDDHAQSATQTDLTQKAPIFSRPNAAGRPQKAKGLAWGKMFALVVCAALIYFYRDKATDIFKKVPWNKFAVTVGQRDLVKETNITLTLLEQAQAHFDQGQSFARQGLSDEAISEIQKALQLRADEPVYYKQLALIYEKKNDYKKAIKAWKDLLKYENDAAQIKIAQQHIEQLTATKN